jgi:hypothetical protein
MLQAFFGDSIPWLLVRDFSCRGKEISFFAAKSYEQNCTQNKLLKKPISISHIIVAVMGSA